MAFDAGSRLRFAACAVVAVCVAASVGACDEPAPKTSPPAEPAKSEPSKEKPAPNTDQPKENQSAGDGNKEDASTTATKTTQTQPTETEPGDTRPAVQSPPPGVEVNKGLPTTKATLGGKQFTLEIAADDKTRATGLMGRTSIPEGTGMVFIFPARQKIIQRFWMKNCLTDMDIIYLDDNGRVLKTHTMRAPQPKQPGQSEYAYEQSLTRYSSGFPCRLAIEIAPGEVKKLGIKEGNQMKLDVEDLKKRAK